MKFRIPFTFSDIERLKRKVKVSAGKIKHKKKSALSESLKNIDAGISREEYIAIVKRTFIFSFLILFVISTSILALLSIKLFYLYGFVVSLLFSFFVFFSQMVYPKIYTSRRQRRIEKDLIPALEDILIQLNSGIPLFSILTNLSEADYGELSGEFKKAVKRINAGEPQEDVLENLGERNSSVFFRRTLWQISNGMRAGSDMSIVIKDSIKALNEEQLIQIQNYGNRLNPLIMFYMLISVIIPSLSVTFLTIISSMINLPKTMTQLIFIGLFVFVVLVQIMFLGMIKSRRPSLL